MVEGTFRHDVELFFINIITIFRLGVTKIVVFPLIRPTLFQTPDSAIFYQ